MRASSVGSAIVFDRAQRARSVTHASRVAMTVLALAVGLAIPVAAKQPKDSSSDISETSQRRASVMRAKAEDLREKANHLRDGEGVKHPNVAKAKQLERQADSLEAQANRLDAQNWPPKD
jgi:hypothetical protein